MESPSPVAAPLPPSPSSPADNTTIAAPPSPASLVMPPPPSPAGKEGNGSSLPTSPPPPGSSKNPALVALGVGVGIGGALVLVCVCLFAIWYKRRKRRLMLATSSSLPISKENLSGSPLHHWKQSTPPADSTIGMLPKLSPPPGIMSNPQSYSMGVSTSHPPTSMNSSLGFGVTVQQSSPGNGFNFSKTIFTYEELAMATDNFSSNYLLGQGGFGYVHKGVLRNGKLVAIKQLKFGSGQGEREFQAEVEIIGHVHHRHLVLLEGYCISGAQRLLVYEYIPNNSLEFHLNGKQESPLNWATRMKIAIGSAKGLVYLHEDCQPRIIHRDIKAANILLDNNFEAKVADFGLARLHSDADTHVSTRVMGTFGYLAPEYALSGKLTDKSDVFSFGVVLLELITGRRPIDKVYMDDNIVDWARPLLTQALNDGNFSTLVDPRLQAYDFAEMTRMVACAAACVRHLGRRRPQMSQIVRALEGNLPLENLNDGIRPGDSMIYGSHGSSDYDSAQYKEDLKKFRKMALESQNLNSSGCSGPTGEFGTHPSGSSSEGPSSTREIVLSQGDKNTTEEDDDAEQIKDISIS